MAAEAETSRMHWSEQHEPEVEQYRPLSGLAVAALILGLLSLAAWIEPFLLFVAAAGMIAAAAALWQVARNAPEMIGRTAALAGLFLSIFSLVGVSANAYTYRTLIREEAVHFAQRWFESLQNGQTDRAFAMTRDSTVKPEPAKEGSPEMPPDAPPPPSAGAYAERPEVRSLVALGDRAQVRYYQTELQLRKETGVEIKQVYAVTFDKDGAKTTFFVRLDMERLASPESGKASWQILGSRGGVKPLAMGGEI